MWYSAHAIFYFHQGQDASFLVHENVYLVQAASAQEALYVAETLGKNNEDMNESGELLLAGKPAQYIFAGIRKIIEVVNAAEAPQGQIGSGAEVTYSEFELASYEDVKKLTKGFEVAVLMKD